MTWTKEVPDSFGQFFIARQLGTKGLREEATMDVGFWTGNGECVVTVFGVVPGNLLKTSTVTTWKALLGVGWLRWDTRMEPPQEALPTKETP